MMHPVSRTVLAWLLGAVTCAAVVGVALAVYRLPLIVAIVLSVGAALGGVEALRMGWGWWVILGAALGTWLGILVMGVFALVLLGLHPIAIVGVVAVLFGLLLANFIMWFPGTADQQDDLKS
jgi:hypothetical protein